MTYLKSLLYNCSELRKTALLRIFLGLAILPLLLQSTVFGANAFTVTSGTIVTNYWNSTNLTATATATSYVSGLDNVKLYMRVNGGGMVEFSGKQLSYNSPPTGNTASWNLTKVEIESTGSLSDGDTFEIYAEFRLGTDVLETVALTTTSITVDQTSPSITEITSTNDNGAYPIGANINITAKFSEPVFLSGGDLEVDLETGASNATVNISTISDSSASGTYTIVGGHLSSDLDAILPLEITGGGGGETLRDAAGNDADLTSVLANLSTTKNIEVDGVSPSAVNLHDGAGTIESTGGTVVADYWNASNTGLDVSVTISGDGSLVGGSVQIQGFWTGNINDAQNLGNPESIGGAGIISFSVGSLESFPGWSEGGVLEIVAIVTDKAGNTSPVGTISDNSITVDQGLPTITSIASGTANGTWGIGDDIDVTLTFSESVVLSSDNLQILMNTGETFIIDAFSNSTASGIYSVVEGNSSSDLDVSSATLIGGSMRDAAGNDAILTVPNLTNLAASSALIIDGIRPTITSVSSSTDNGYYGIGEDINVTVTFSESVTMSGGSLTANLNVGQAATINSIAQNTVVSGTYTVQTNDASSALSAISPLALSGGETLKDAAGNNAVLTFSTNINPARTIVVDGIVPSAIHVGTVIASGGTVVADYWNSTNDFLDVTVTIPDDASLVEGTIQIKGYWDVVGNAQNLWTAQTIGAKNASKKMSIPAATLESFPGFDEAEILNLVVEVTDRAGNVGPIGNASSDLITIDTEVPTITSFTSDTGDGYINLQSAAVDVDITFSESVKLVGNNLQVEMETGDGTDETFIINAFDYSATASGLYSIQEGNESDDLSVNSVSLLAGTLRDAAGNDADLSIPTNSNLDDNSTIIVDGVIPTIVSVTSSTLSGNYPIGQNINVTVAFSEAVTLSGGTLTANLDIGQGVDYSGISGATTIFKNYTIVAGDSSAGLSVNSPLVLSGVQTLKDVAGNAANLSDIPININTSKTLVIDGVVPRVFTVGTIVTVGSPVVENYWNIANTGMTVSVPVGNDGSLVGGSVQIQGFYGDISGAENIGNPTTITAGMLGTSINMNINTTNINTNVGFSEGQTLKITAKITDKAGNSKVGTASADDFIIDETSPVLSSITSDPSADTLKKDDTADIIMTFSEPVFLAGGNLQTTLETGDILTSIPTDFVSNTVTEIYTVGEDDESDDLSVTSLALTAGTLRDAAGNDVPLGIPAAGTNLNVNSALVIDGVIPTILSITSTSLDGYYKIGDVVDIVVTFSEPVSISAGNSLVLTMDTDAEIGIGGISNTNQVSGTYTIQPGDESADLTVSGLSKDGGNLTDAAGNEVTLTTIPINIDDDSDLIIDGIVPINFQVGSIVTVGGTIYSGYWNSTNTAMTVTVPIDNEPSLVGGSVQVEGYYGNISGAADIGTPRTITVGMLGSSIDVSISLANIVANVGLNEGQTLKLTAEIYDVAGNSKRGTASANQFIVDETVPVISAITSDPTSGTFKETDPINITITFSENVTLFDGNLQTTLETGDILTSITTDLDGTSGSVTEIYTVGVDDESGDLSVSSLGLSAGKLRDKAGNDVVLGIPPIGTNLSDNSNLVIDGTIPTIVRISTPDPSAYYGVGDTVDVVVKFSENVTFSGGTSFQVTLDTGLPISIDEINSIDSVIIPYEVQELDESDALTATSVSLNGGTLQDGAGNDVIQDITSSTNIDDGVIIYIDGIYPNAFTTGEILTVGEPVITGFWNTLNTSLQVIIPVTGSDVSLNGGSAYLEARMDGNNYASVGDTVAVGTNPLTMSLTRAELEAELPGYFAGDVIEVRGVLIDIAGNKRNGVVSAISLTNDQVIPALTITGDIVVAGGSVSQGYWNPSNETITVSAALNLDNTLINGVFQLQRRIGVAGTFTNIANDSIINTVNTTMMTVLEADEVNAFGFSDGDIIDFRGIVTDEAGNSTIGSSGDNSIIIDSGDPIDFTVGEVNPMGGVVVDGYYNASNLGATVTVPIDPLDNTLVGGYVQLRSILNSDPAVKYLDSLDISTLSDMLFSITRAELDGLAYSEGDTLKFDAIITDVAGNSTIGTQSVEFLKVDEIAPTVNATDNVQIQGTNLVAGYWNSTSTGVIFKVEIDVTDLSLVGGILTASADLTPSPNTVFETFATTRTINSLGTDSISLTIPAAEIEAIEGGTGFDDGLSLSFRIAIRDVAGNRATSATLAGALDIDQTPPVIGSFVAARTTTDPFINNEDSLLAKWQGFSDATTSVDKYEYSVSDGVSIQAGGVGPTDFGVWMSLNITTYDTLFSYTHENAYSIKIRAVDLAGNISDTLSTDAITADLVEPTSTTDLQSYYYTGDWDNVNSFGGTADDALSGPDSLLLWLQRTSDSFWWDGTAWAADIDSFDYKIDDGTWSFGIDKANLDNREDYTVSLKSLDSAGNWQVLAGEYDFQFVINTPPEFAEITDTLFVDEDALFDYEIIATDVDLGTISDDTLFYSILSGPDSMRIDSLTAVFDWTPENADVAIYTITAKVRDLFDESDTTSFILVVNQVNDAPEPVTLLLPADSTQLLASNGLDLTFKWSSAFDIEGDSVNYRIYMQGTDYDTSIYAAGDTTITVDVSIMDFPTVDPVEWFVRALDAADTSVTADTFHVTTSSPSVVLLADSVMNQMLRYTDKDTVFTLSNAGLTNLRWSVAYAPSWISFTEEAGVVEFLDTNDVDFNIDLGGITVGTYLDSIDLVTNDPEQDTITIFVGLRILDTPTPVLAFYKNPAYPGSYELMIVDSIGMIDTLKVRLAGEELTVTEVDTFSYLVSVEIETAGTKSFEVYASNWAGDTTITTNLAVSLAKRGVPWLAKSSDEQFELRGSAHSVNTSGQIAILDTMISAANDARYKVLSDGMSMAEPVLVSMPATKERQAIYTQSPTGEYVELPSMSDGERISAWADRLGAFKIGPQTIIVPEKSKLTQNYPNPFNPSTTIEYDVGFLDGLHQNIEFSVYNIIGQSVRTLVDKQVSPGHYSVVWNGLNDEGNQVSSGIYFARLMTDKGYAKTVKMLVLR